MIHVLNFQRKAHKSEKKNFSLGYVDGNVRAFYLSALAHTLSSQLKFC